MTGVRIRMLTDGAGGARPAAACGDGRAVVRLCGCEVCVCCGTGNQCLYYGDLDAALADDPCAEVQAVAGIAHANRLNGWTRLGTAFDVVITAACTYLYSDIGHDIAAALTVEPRRLRFRLGPAEATNAELIDLFGPTTDEAGVWLQWGRDGGGLVNKYRSCDSPAGVCSDGPCQRWWYDRGHYTGTHTYEETGEATISKSAEGGIAADLDIPISPLNGHLSLLPPLVRQALVRSDNTLVSNILCDGMAWGVFGRVLDAGGYPAELKPAPLSIGHPVHGAAYRPPWWSTDPCEQAAETIKLNRAGGSFTASAGGGNCAISVAIQHGEEASLVYSHNETAVGGGTAIDETWSITVKLERIPEAQCPAYDSLPANECEPVEWEHRVGRACGNPARVVIFDPATRPTPAEDWPTFLHTGDDEIERRYIATDEASPLDAEAVTWSEDDCPDPTPLRCIAHICAEHLISEVRPATVVYTVNTLIGAGNGRVRLSRNFPNPACPQDRTCVEWVEYRPTLVETDDPRTPATEHIGGTPCMHPYLYGICVGCDEPGPIPESEGLMHLPNPMAAQLKHFGGGCCG